MSLITELWPKQWLRSSKTQSQLQPIWTQVRLFLSLSMVTFLVKRSEGLSSSGCSWPVTWATLPHFSHVPPAAISQECPFGSLLPGINLLRPSHQQLSLLFLEAGVQYVLKVLMMLITFPLKKDQKWAQGLMGRNVHRGIIYHKGKPRSNLNIHP